MHVHRLLASRRFRTLGLILVAVTFIPGVYVAFRLNDDRAVAYESVEDHFRYGSTGGERGWKNQLGFGIPYWMWISLPEIFADYLPDRQPNNGYASFGLTYERGKDPRFDLPIGMSMRRVQGIDRVYFTCSVCHAGRVRETSNAEPLVVLGMPANTLDFGRLIGFLRRTADDSRFEPSRMMGEIDRLEQLREREYRGNAAYQPAELGVIDTALFKYLGVSMMRDQLIEVTRRLSFIDFNAWGPGRVDTFGPAKALLGFPMDAGAAQAGPGISDFTSVWHQKARKGMHLHWDGNNCSVDERNLSASFGTGATPATLDLGSVLRIADYLWDTAKPAPFPSGRIDAVLAGEGESIYREYCATCHGTRAVPFRTPAEASHVGEVTAIEDVRTDPSRLDSYTAALAQAQNSLYAGFPSDEESCRAYIEDACRPGDDDAAYRALRARCYPSRFSHFRKTWGYANQPLDGLWLRAPYLHNGSVPSLRALLDPVELRPREFYIGYDVYDFEDVGFTSLGPEAERYGWKLDTRVPGNGNGGHDGEKYGTGLARHQKDALIEYLKTF